MVLAAWEKGEGSRERVLRKEFKSSNLKFRCAAA
jgi:hypothetical protein